MSDFLSFVSSHGTANGSAESVEQAFVCLDRFTEAFNHADLDAMDAHLAFPHIMLSGSSPLVWSTPGNHPADFFDKLRATGWASTRYESKTPVLVSTDKVHAVVTYSRLGKNEEVLSRHTNLWIVVCIQGAWRIALRSY